MNRRTTRLAPSSCLQQQGFKDALQRLSMALMLLMLTTATARAQNPATIGSIQYNSTLGAYEINCTDNLNDLAVYVNGSGSYSTGGDETTPHDCTDLTFKMTDDVAYSYTTVWNSASSEENNYTAIGMSGKYFNGNFDGQGHKVSGIRIYRGGNGDSDQRQGLFGATNNAVIRGITLADARITGYHNVGGIVGQNGIGTVSFCHVAGNVAIHTVQSGSICHGGIAGQNFGTVSDCTCSATLTMAENSNLYGGIVGQNTGTENPTLRHNLANGAVVPETVNAIYGATYDAICGNSDGTFVNNYYRNCNVTDAKATTAYLVTIATDGVSIETKMADNLGFSYDSDGNGIAENYWKAGAELTLGYTLGEVLDGYTLSYAATAGTISGSTLTVGDQDATVSATIRSDGQSHTVTYMKADGTSDTHEAIALDETMTSLDAGKWYYVGKNIDYTQTVRLGDGEVTILLGDGKTMNIGSSESGISRGNGIKYGDYMFDSSLTIYGQTLDDATAGHLNIYMAAGLMAGNNEGIVLINDYTQHSGNVSIITVGKNDNCINVRNFTLYGGTLSATTGESHAITAYVASTILGGKLDATIGSSTYRALHGGSGITLGWTNAADHIHVSSYDGTVKIATGQSFYNGSEVLTGTVSDKDKLNGKTLTPAVVLADNSDNTSAIATAATACTGGKTLAVQLSGHTLYKDGYWNTLTLPFDVSTTSGPLSGDNVKAMVLDGDDSGLSGTTLTLNFDDAPATIPAGTPFIIKWDNTSVNLTENDLVFTGVTIDDTKRDVAFTGGTFKGNYAPLEITVTGDNPNCNDIVELVGNKLGYATTDRTILNGKALGAFHAYFYIPANGGNQLAHSFELNTDNGETTGIISTTDFTDKAGAWYTLDGRKLQGKPMQRGIYINKGRQVVIK